MALAYQPATNALELALNWTTEGREWKNILHLTTLDGEELFMPSQEDVNDIADETAAEFAPFMCMVTKLNSVTLKDIRSQEGATIQSSVATLAGLQNNSPISLNTALAITLRTAVGGRTGRGRMYLTGWAEGLATAREIQAPLAASLVLCVNNINLRLSHLNLGLAVLSRWLNKERRTSAIARLVTAVACTDLRLDSQRRRLGK